MRKNSILFQLKKILLLLAIEIIMIFFSCISFAKPKLFFAKNFRLSGGINTLYYLKKEKYFKSLEYLVAKKYSSESNLINYKQDNSIGYSLSLEFLPLLLKTDVIQFELVPGIEIYNYEDKISINNNKINYYKDAIQVKYSNDFTKYCNFLNFNIICFDFIFQSKISFSHIDVIRYSVSFSDNTSFSGKFTQWFEYYNPDTFYFVSIGKKFNLKGLVPFSVSICHTIPKWTTFRSLSINTQIYL
jgi:hypothetical protein